MSFLNLFGLLGGKHSKTFEKAKGLVEGCAYVDYAPYNAPKSENEMEKIRKDPRLLEAEKLFLDIIHDEDKNPRPFMGGVFLQLGFLHILEKRWENALEYFKRCEEIMDPFKNSQSPDHEGWTQYSMVLFHLAEVYNALGRYQESVMYYERSLEIDKRLNRSEHAQEIEKMVRITKQQMGMWEGGPAGDSAEDTVVSAGAPGEGAYGREED